MAILLFTAATQLQNYASVTKSVNLGNRLFPVRSLWFGCTHIEDSLSSIRAHEKNSPISPFQPNVLSRGGAQSYRCDNVRWESNSARTLWPMILVKSFTLSQHTVWLGSRSVKVKDIVRCVRCTTLRYKKFVSGQRSAKICIFFFRSLSFC